MKDYFNSLNVLLKRDDDVYLPGHGPALREPRDLVRAMLAHRVMRENAIAEKLKEGPASTYTLMDTLYSQVHPRLRRAAERNVLAHLLKLEAEVDMAGLERVLETGARLSARNLIAIAPDGVESRVVDNLGRVAELSASYGVRTCLESMIYMGVKTMAQASRIIDQTGRGDIGMVIDPLHLDRASDRVADVAGLDPARIASIQLCDAGPRPDPSDLETLVFESRTQRLIPGTGTLPLQELLRVIPAGVPVELEVPTVGLIGTMPDAEIAAMMRDAALAILAAG